MLNYFCAQTADEVIFSKTMRIGAVSAGNHKALSKPAHKRKHSALVFGNANPAAIDVISKRVSYRNIQIIK